MQRLKILFVTRTMQHGGGAERLLFDIYTNLKKRENIDCKLIYMLSAAQNGFPESDYFEKLLKTDKDVYHIPWAIDLKLFTSNTINIKAYKEIVDEFQPDIIHSHLYMAELLSREYIYPKAKYFTHVHDNMQQLKKLSAATFLDKKTFTDYIEGVRIKKKYKQVDNFFLTISHDTFNFINENAAPKPKHNFLLFNSINHSLYVNPLPKKLPSGKIRFLNIGTVVEKKNQDFLVDVMHILKWEGIDFELNILGSFTPYYKSVQQKIDTYKLNKKVFLRGNVSDTIKYLHQADIYLHSATYEPFGLVLLEAMAAGLPVISYDGRGNRDIIENGKNGFILTKPKPEQFAEKILFLLKNNNEYESISNYAKEFSAKYDVTPYCDKLLQLYKSAIEKNILHLG